MAPVCVALAILAIPGAAEEDPAPHFTLEAFLQVPTLGAPALSPDGGQVAYLHRKRSLDQDERLVSLWVAPTDGGKPKRITFSDATPGSIAWRPGGGLSYRRSAGEGEPPQVWLNPLDGSEPRPVTDLEQGVGAYWWSPDGGRLAILARVPDEPAEGAEDESERIDWTVYDRLEQPDRYPQLWILEVDEDGPGEAEPRRLTSPPLYSHHTAFSPDGGTVALTYNPRFSSLVDEEQRIDLVDLETGERTSISPPDRHASLAAFSPDGNAVAYFVDRREELRAYLNLKDVAVYDRASGKTRILTAETDMTLGGAGSTPARAPLWTADGERLVVVGTRGTSMDLYAVDADGESRLEALTELDGNLGGFDVSAGRLVYLESELHRPGSLHAAPLDDSAGARLIDSTDDAVARYQLEPPTKLALPGHEGQTVEGFLFLPEEGAEGRPHPAVIEMHGGPYYRYGNAWTTRYPWQVLADSGFAVFIANPRGGTGYGEAFLRGNYRGFGTDDYRDLMAAVDALIERGIVDPQRIGFTGYSYGGLMTNTVISRTDRFAAAVSIAGLFNFVSAMGQNNPQLLIDAYRRPWDDDLARLWEHSPASRAASIDTPTLIMHGEEDQAVDPRQSIEMFTFLQLNGVPSRLVLYPGEGHGIDRPSHMLDYQRRELEWFQHYLLGDPEAEGAAAPMPVEAPAPGA
jgi:dipeptidyl aminopeptidase/acylaminoacyl peptidase